MKERNLPIDEPIAIIGAACRFPGEVHDLSSFWNLLKDGVDAISSFPKDRFSKDRYLSKNRGLDGFSYVDAAGIISDIKTFDPDFFGVSRKEAEAMDPQQRLALETAWEAIEQAHIQPSTLKGSDTGVFVGASNMDMAMQNQDDPPVSSPYSMTGSTLSIIANRISYYLDLHGQSLTIDTACSSSLTAIHVACEALRAGKISMALAGGVNILLTPFPFIGFSRARMLSPDGRCKVFDASGNGYVRSEGAGMVLLKPLSAAKKDGDSILGVIVGSGINSDGRTTGIALPNEWAQRALLEDVYQRFSLDKNKLAYVEAHGTGTAAGDPLEASAIGSILGQPLMGRRKLYVGSVKTNIGHLEPASGVAGLIKSLLIFRHGAIPANIHLKTPNPAIDFVGLNIDAPTTLVDLPSLGGGELISINSFGFGGSNAHLVIQKPGEEFSEKRKHAQAAPLLLSAKSPASLAMAAGRLADHLDDSDLSDCYNAAATIAYCREAMPFRAVISGESPKQICLQLRQLESAEEGSKEAPSIEEKIGEESGGIFAYSGNGGQWCGMGAGLYKANADFRNALQEIDDLLSPLQGWSLIDAFENPQNHEDTFDLAEKSQPLLFALQVGLTRALAAKGVHPSGVVGHSVGEVAAAWAAGILSLEDATKVIHHRSHMQSGLRGKGSMAVANMSESAAKNLLAEMAVNVEIAAINTSASLTLSGDTEALQSVVRACKKRRIAAKMLSLSYPFHTAFMDDIKDDLLFSLKDVKPQKAKIPFFSTAVATSGEAVLDAAYWWRNVRYSVYFMAGVEKAMGQGFRRFLEIGPSPILGSYIRDIGRTQEQKIVSFSSLQREKDEAQDFDLCWQKAWRTGWLLDKGPLFKEAYDKVDLPSYSWNREYVWFEDSPENRGYLKRDRLHPLLGWRLPLQAPVFENTIGLADYPWLADHVAGTSTPYPAAAFIESMLAAAKEIVPGEQQELEWVSIFRPLNFSDNGAKTIRLSVDREDGGLTLEARNFMSAEPWGLYGRGRIALAADSPVLEPLVFGDPEAFGVAVTKEALYESASSFHLHYGPAFQTVKKAWGRSENKASEMLAALSAPTPASAEGMMIAPTLLDGAFQTMFILIGANLAEAGRHAYLPASVERVVLYRAGTPCYAHIRLERISPRSIVASFRLIDEVGETLLYIKNCRFRRASWLDSEKDASKPYKISAILKDHPAQRSALETPSAEHLFTAISDVLKQSGANAQKDQQAVHPYLLLQLASVSAMHETMLALAEKSLDLDIDALLANGSLAPDCELWARHMQERLVNQGLATVINGKRRIAPKDDRPSARVLWRTILGSSPGYLPEAALLSHVMSVAGDILSSRSDGKDATIPAHLVDAYYAGAQAFRPFAEAAKKCVAQVLEAANPGQIVNILQIARDSKGMLQDVVPLLKQAPCRYVVAAEDKASAEALSLSFDHNEAVDFIALDLEATPEGEKGKYHLIIASFTLHDRLNALGALKECVELLAPGGYLCLQEHASSAFADFVFGAEKSWWAGSAEREKPVSLLLSRTDWQEQMAAAGLTDITAPGRENDNAGPAFMALGRKSVRAVTFETAEKTPRQAGIWRLASFGGSAAALSLTKTIAGALEQGGETVLPLLLPEGTNEADSSAWGDILAGCSDKQPFNLLFAIGYDDRDDISGAELSEIAERGVSALTAFAQAWDKNRAPVRLWVLTGGALAGGMRQKMVPSQGAVLGFARVLMNEARGLDLRVIDLHGAVSEITGLAQELIEPAADAEIILDAAGRYVPRLERLTSSPSKKSKAAQGAAKLTFDQPGRLQNLHWEKTALPVVGSDEVLIEVKNVGLNFRDVMWSMGMLLDEALENGFSGPTMGIECSGIVTSVGPEAKGWKAGDEVVCFAPACFGSHVVTKSAAIARKPETISFAEAATIPVTFITAWYALKHLANMQPGERVLIHGAAGGVGLAAVQIARHLGLEIYATAGADEKHHFLRQLGVSNILSSRSMAFASQIREMTQGEGVDAVLNSLAGEAISAGISVLRPFGRFLELGKRDFYADTPMRLRPFANNLSYFGVDVDQLLVYQPALAQKLFKELMDLFAARKLVPLPHTIYPVSRTISAFQAMQASSHIGKLVVSTSGAGDLTVDPKSSLSKTTLSKNASYLITGGAGGFGLASAQRLAQRGARHLILLSRSGPKDEKSLAAVKAMEADGVEIAILRADVADEAQLNAVLSQHLKKAPPLKGIIHAAAVLEDGIIVSLTPERIRASLAAKAVGAWNLHRFSSDLTLDFFVLYSSATTAFGNPGQGGYVAANCVLEALSAYRVSQKRPASVIGWGPIDDVGMITRNAKAKKMLHDILGVSTLTSHDALYWLEHCIDKNIDSSHFFGLDWNNRGDLPALAQARFSHLRSTRKTTRSEGGSSVEQIRALGPEKGQILLARELMSEVAAVLRLPADRLTVDTPFVSLGMDSLMAVELALAIEQKFEITGYSLPLSEKTTAANLSSSLYGVIAGNEGDSGETAEQTILDEIEQRHGLELSDVQREAVLDSIKKDAE